MTRYPTAVIGLGKIGQEYDYASHDDSFIVTHAHAFSRHPGFELVGGVDPRAAQRRKFTKKFNAPAFTSLSALLRHTSPTVFALAVPTPQHAHVARDVLTAHPHLLLCEKPLAATVGDARWLVRAATQKKCSLAVNYMRRFEPGVNKLKKMLATDSFGTIYKGTVWYGNGLRNNGSHFIDLLTWLLGPVKEVSLIAPGRVYRGDPEPDVLITYASAAIACLAICEEHFTLSGFELVGTKGTIRYSERGTRIETRQVVPDPQFPGYSVLQAQPQLVPNDLLRCQWHVVDSLYRHLKRGTPLPSTGGSALKTLAVVESIVRLLA